MFMVIFVAGRLTPSCVMSSGCVLSGRRYAAGLVESQLILVTVVIQRSMVGLGRVDVRIASMVAVLY